MRIILDIKPFIKLSKMQKFQFIENYFNCYCNQWFYQSQLCWKNAIFFVLVFSSVISSLDLKNYFLILLIMEKLYDLKCQLGFPLQKNIYTVANQKQIYSKTLWSEMSIGFSSAKKTFIQLQIRSKFHQINLPVFVWNKLLPYACAICWEWCPE